mmetsp:Transcript_862/g.1662  ORF Transcript_862/g.1662 Transcript_862/m.1662 type:complete len:289 (+) Transcript_862:1507-2373(+)
MEDGEEAESDRKAAVDAEEHEGENLHRRWEVSDSLCLAAVALRSRFLALAAIALLDVDQNRRVVNLHASQLELEHASPHEVGRHGEVVGPGHVVRVRNETALRLLRVPVGREEAVGEVQPPLAVVGDGEHHVIVLFRVGAGLHLAAGADALCPDGHFLELPTRAAEASCAGWARAVGTDHSTVLVALRHVLVYLEMPIGAHKPIVDARRTQALVFFGLWVYFVRVRSHANFPGSHVRMRRQKRRVHPCDRWGHGPVYALQGGRNCFDYLWFPLCMLERHQRKLGEKWG